CAAAARTRASSAPCSVPRASEERTMTTPISRRDLLKVGGAVVVTFSANAILPRWTIAQTAKAPADTGKPLDISDVDSFLAIHRDGTVTVYTGKVDIGTGLRIAVAQMAAEER